MSVKNYQKMIPVLAIQFQGNNAVHTAEVFSFVEVHLSIDLAGNVVEFRLIIDPLKPLVVPVRDFIVKDVSGKLKHMKQAEFEAEYTVVELGL